MDGADRIRTPFGAFLRGVGDEIAGASADPSGHHGSHRRHWRQLSKETAPIAGESLRSLVYRVCTRNELPNSWGLLQHLGQAHRNRVHVAEDPGIDPAELAYALQVDEGEVVSRRYPRLGNGHVSFFGLDLHSRQIDRRVRRFSPNHLKTIRHHLAVWELRDLPFCLRGWDMLQDRCWCERDGIVQGWSRTQTAIDLCDRCGDPLRWLDPFTVPAPMRPALAIIEPLVDPSPEVRAATLHRLPPGLRERDRSAVFYLLVRMAEACDPDGANRSPERPAERLAGLHGACVALSRWPKGLDDMRWDDRVTGGTIAAIRSLWGRLEHSPKAPRTVASVHRAQHGDGALPARAQGDVGVRRATEIAGLSRQTLLDIWDNDLVRKREKIHGSKVLPAFDPDEIGELGKMWRRRLDLDSVARQLGIPRYGVEQLVATGVIPADAPALPRSGLFFNPETVDGLKVDLERRAVDTDSLDQPTSLRHALNRIGGRPKPWGPILDAMLADRDAERRMAFGLIDADSLGDGIFVCRRDVRRIEAMSFDRANHLGSTFATRMVQRDALDLLNSSPGGANLLEELDREGENPITYAVSDVERRATEIVTLREIAALCDMDINPANVMMANWPAVSARNGMQAWRREMLPQVLGSWQSDADAEV